MLETFFASLNVPETEATYLQTPIIGYSSTTWYKASHITLKALRGDAILSLKNLNFPPEALP